MESIEPGAEGAGMVQVKGAGVGGGHSGELT